MRFRALILAAALALAACQTVPAPKTPAQAVFEAKATYAATLTIAVQYKNLPSCALPMHPVICSDAAVVMKLQRADDIAKPALDSAEAAVRNPDFGKSLLDTAVIAANNAVTALTSITQTLKAM